jgi:hypothetical protein
MASPTLRPRNVAGRQGAAGPPGRGWPPGRGLAARARVASRARAGRRAVAGRQDTAGHRGAGDPGAQAGRQAVAGRQDTAGHRGAGDPGARAGRRAVAGRSATPVPALRAGPDAAPAAPARVNADAAGLAFRPAGDRLRGTDVAARAACAARLPVSLPPACPGRPRSGARTVFRVAGDGDQEPADGLLFASTGAGASADALDDVDREPGHLPRDRRGLQEEVSVKGHHATLALRTRTWLRVLLALRPAAFLRGMMVHPPAGLPLLCHLGFQLRRLAVLCPCQQRS